MYTPSSPWWGWTKTEPDINYYSPRSERERAFHPLIPGIPQRHPEIIVQPNPENVNPPAMSEDSLQLHKSHIRLWVEQIQQPSWSYNAISKGYTDVLPLRGGRCTGDVSPLCTRVATPVSLWSVIAHRPPVYNPYTVLLCLRDLVQKRFQSLL